MDVIYVRNLPENAPLKGFPSWAKTENDCNLSLIRSYLL